jgi:molybdopterin-binding protein
MNTIASRIVRIEREGNLHVVGFETEETVLWMMGLELPRVSIGDRVLLGFKSTSSIIARDEVGKISFSNRLKGTVGKITEGKLLYSVLCQTHAGPVETIMTRRAYEHLELAEGMDVTIFVKASEVAIKEVLGD